MDPIQHTLYYETTESLAIDRFSPPPVPPHARERCVVGAWVYGVDQRREVETTIEGHDQPRLPADLGYYDLRVPEVRTNQAALAQAYGIEAFCYWHYWFGGKRLLRRPIDEIRQSAEPQFPFCLAWANESWSRRWLGEERDVLIKQTYSADDDRDHARWLAQAFSDPRYLRVDGRPLFLVYRPGDLPHPHRTTDTIRTECTRMGLREPYLLGVNAHSHHDCVPAGVAWQVIGISQEQWLLVSTALALGGNIRVGLEDNFYLSPAKMAEGNGPLVEKAARMARDIGREPATVEEARTTLKLYRRGEKTREAE